MTDNFRKAFIDAMVNGVDLAQLVATRIDKEDELKAVVNYCFDHCKGDMFFEFYDDKRTDTYRVYYSSKNTDGSIFLEMGVDDTTFYFKKTLADTDGVYDTEGAADFAFHALVYFGKRFKGELDYNNEYFTEI